MDEATTRAAVTAHWQAWAAAGGDETDAESVEVLLRRVFGDVLLWLSVGRGSATYQIGRGSRVFLLWDVRDGYATSTAANARKMQDDLLSAVCDLAAGVPVRPAEGEPLIASLDKFADLLDEDFSGRTVDEILGRDAPEDCPGCVALRDRCERLAAVVAAAEAHDENEEDAGAWDAYVAARSALKPGDLPARAAESEGTK